MNFNYICRRIRSRNSLYACLLAASAVIIIIIYCRSVENYVEDGFIFQPEEKSPYSGPTFFFIVPELRVLNLRTACAIEAAAFHHPQSQVVVYTLSESNSFEQLFNIFKNISNVNFQHISIPQAFNNTPLHGLFRDKKSHEFENSHVLMHALVSALITKRGGVYLTNDLWCLNSISDFRNLLFIEKESYTISIAMFDRWHRIPTLVMKKLKNALESKYKSDKDALHHTFKDFCLANNDDFLIILNYPQETCAKTKFVISPELIFPTFHNKWKVLFRNKFTNESLHVINSYSFIKLWDYFSQNTKLIPGSGVIIDAFAKRICSTVYDVMKTRGKA